MKKFECIRYYKEDGSARIVLNRPQVLNAINRHLFSEWEEAFDDAIHDPEVRVLVFSGEGRAFCSGHDLKETATEDYTSPDDWRRALKGTMDFAFKIWDCDKPSIAVVHGYCLGQGVQMALACDFVIATEDAIIGEPEVRTVTTSAFHIVPWLVGLRRAKELYLTGAKITGVEAAEMGLINKAVPADRLDEAVKGLVQQLTSMPPAAVALNKRAINKTHEIMGLRNSIAYNLEVLSLTHSVESLGGTQAEFSRIVQQKGLKAALEKRDTVS